MTNILAIIGAITGIAGLSIQFISYLSSKPKINFSQSSKPHKSLYVVPLDGTFGIINGHQVNSTTPYSAVCIQMTINNQSSQPVTILAPWITFKGKKINTFRGNDVSLNSPSFTTDDGKMTLTNTFPQQPPLKFPLRIDGFDSLSGSVTFIIFNDDQFFKSTKVYLPTTNKIFKRKFNLDEFSEWHRMATEDLKS
ncbi:hypothetical protein [Leuconostoc pseudomesenteroides]|uniref:DUF4352 domain-containing protein n=1 Tax=Leuconostoc pseudomesenteroides TaxID=33968 RepID=A0ABT6HBI5_LEUPS|nr:hypothetical protein [Leuconostoc pseudomesenteroides]MDG9733449.1 hypothetical protein [Leuconostoc pseudomesenteroides]NKZ36108.1 hypothetical protein [Leuconostoc pseudomesenteroides]QQB26702.1 hypothetical protein I6H60_06445 [Leuconostoc pseudomesenteroides]QQB26754.1 hypothetical protein I6H60_06710 [Leuconostoc pseudomesenteroides]